MVLVSATRDGPSLYGKTAVVTGGSSGIGLATTKVLASKGAKVLNLDPCPPPETEHLDSGIKWYKCDQSSWAELLEACSQVDQIDIAVANGGIGESANYFDDTFDENGVLQLPDQGIFDINLKGSINFVKIAVSRMRRQENGGSIVLVTSASAYCPEHSLPLYAACKAAMVGLLRTLRSSSMLDKISINSVAPAATITNQLPKHLAAPIIASGLPVSQAEHVAWAIYYVATAQQERRVEPYGADSDDGDDVGAGKLNGRAILTLGSGWSEIEEPLARCKPQWWGEEETVLTRKQQALTDARKSAWRARQHGIDNEDTV